MSAVERRYTYVQVELRAKGDRPKIGGYAAVFNRPSQNLGGFIEQVTPSAFDRAKGNDWPEVLARYNHDDNQLLGTSAAGTLQLRIDGVGLDYEVDPPKARADILELVERGDVRKSSFAFRVFPDGDDWTLSEQGFPMRSLLSVQLVDVAPVNAPAYLDTTAGMRSLAAKFEAEFEEVRSLAEANELRRFFVKTEAGMPAAKPKPRTFGPAAAAALLAKKQDPWG
jgi:HK97 family phage prohead protease